MLESFLKRHDIDLMLLQEVTHENIHMISQYTAHMNIGTEGRGTAILAKEGLLLTNIQRIPSGRGIAATLQGIRIVNLYAPSGSEKRREREVFYNEEIVTLIPTAHTEMILGGDFNCVLSTADCTGQGNYSKALARLVRGLDLRDAWDETTTRTVFTHYTTKGASRIDRIYITNNLKRTQKGAEAVVAAFTDHMAIILRLAIDIPCVIRGKGYWHMNVTFLNDPHFQHKIQETWETWKRHFKYYPNRVSWWCRYVKRMIQLIFSREGADRRRDRVEMENFYYSAIYDAIREQSSDETRNTTLKRLKAKIIRLNSTHYRALQVDVGEGDRLRGEGPSLHHLLQGRKRKKQRTILHTLDHNGALKTTTVDILRLFTEHMKQKYDRIPTSAESMRRLLECELHTVLDGANEVLEEPITIDELSHAVKQGKSNKAPGRDGICLEFYKKTWETTKQELLEIMNDMYREGQITDQQKHGIIVCVPKHTAPTSPKDYRPLTLLNTDYKLLTRIIANRLRPCLTDILHPAQHCGIPGTTVFEALATIRDAVAYAEVSGTPLCILSIDFTEAFDRISHAYLFELLRKHGFSERFRQRLRNIYSNATSAIQINGFRSKPIPINCAVRQGCPLSMVLYAFCLNPLLCTLDKHLTGLSMGRRHVRTSVIAYADDVTILVTSPSDIPKIQDALRCYEEATGARVNTGKSRAIAIGSWDASLRIMDIPYQDEAKILGLHITTTVQASAIRSWTLTTARIRACAQEAYYRNLSLDKRVQYVHDHLMARVWYMAQIYPPPDMCMRQLNSSIAWFLWRGDIFRVPLSTMQRRKDEGGWELKHLTAKSHALFLNRMREQRTRQGTVTAEWMRRWGLTGTSQNPPDRDRIPATMDYLRRYAVDSAYVAERGPTESQKGYKRRVYDTLHHISRMEVEPREMRVTTIWQTTDWSSVWKNLAETPVAGEKKAAWYKVIHDIIPTNERLHRIRIAPTDKCRHCDRQDTILHRLTECGDGERIWKWTRQRLAHVLRTIPGRIPSEWLLRPHFTLWPPTRRRAVQWILANLVFFRTQMQRELTLHDLMDFMKRTKWKMYQRKNRRECVANYLLVIDTER